MFRIRFLITLVGALALQEGGRVLAEGVVARVENEHRAKGEGHATRFELVDEKRSGLVFKSEYTHPDRWTKLWHQYFLGTIGSGVALGDFDGDGWADIFAVGKDSPNGLFINQGEFTFADRTHEARVSGGGGIGAGATCIDIDNDGDLDIYVVYTGSPNELFINDGSGRFEERAAEWGLSISTGSNAPSFADFDRDGDLDLYLQCNFLTESGMADGMPDLLFENKGTHFVEITEASGIKGNAQGHAAIWWDYDEDGWPDLYVANDFEPADHLYRNNKDGSFSDVIGEVLVSAPYSSMGADLGDVNNDGHIDFIAAEMSASDHQKAQRTVLAIGTKLIRAPRSTVSQYMKNMLSLKIGPSQFLEASYLGGLNATDWTWAPRLVDLDNDGLLDAFFTNGMVRAFHDGDIGLKSTQARTGWQRMAYFKASPQYDEQNLAYKNFGDLDFRDVSEDWGLDLVGVSFSAAFADFDRDGDLDFVLSNLDQNLSLYRNGSEDRNAISFQLEGVASNSFGVGAKIKLYVGDQVMVRELSLTRGYLSNDELVLHFGLGDAQYVERVEIRWPSGTFQVLEDLEANGRYVVRETASEGEPVREGERQLFKLSAMPVDKESVSEEERFQLFPQQMMIPAVETRAGPLLRVRDFDGDGWDDVLLGGATGQETRLLRNDAGKRLKWMEMDAFDDDYDCEDRGITVFDFEDDGDLDLLVSSGSIELDEGDEYYEDRLYLQNEDGKFERVSHSTFAPESRTSGPNLVFDCDNDGDLDFLIAGGTLRQGYPHHERNEVWIHDGNRYRRDEESDFARSFAASGNISDFEACDWSGDGRVDIVQTVLWGEPVFWKMTDKGLVRDNALPRGFPMSGVWRSVSSGDFDGDGLIDVVLGNYGLNTKYDMESFGPYYLFSSTNELLSNTYIEAYTIEGELYPVDSKLLHDIQFPGLLDKRCSSIEAYASMTVNEAFSDELISKYDRFEFNESRSLLLRQLPEGGFEVSALPRLAQSGALIDSLPADMDGDGDLDLVLSLEMLAPNPWAERFLKGHVLLMINDGKGQFEVLLPWKSGLEVDGYPRELAWADLDKDGLYEVVISMNEGPLLVFERVEEE